MGVLVAGLGLQPIVATLILMVAGRGLAQLLTDGQIVTVYYQPYFFIGSGYLFGLPFSLFLVAAVFIITAVLMRKTALGLFIQAVGINPVAARLAGIKTATLIFFVYVFCAACAGLSGLMISSNIKSADANNAGLMLELDAILAVTLGGTSLAGGKFSLVGSMIGALIIQTLTYTIYSLGVPPEVNMVVKSVVVFLVCLSQSSEFKQIAASEKSMKGLLHTPYFTSLVTVLLLVVMLGLGGAAYPGLLSTQVIFNLLIDNAFLLVIAVGMTFVIVSGGIDLSVGSVLALSTMIAAWLLNVAHWPPLLVIVTVLALGTVFGAGMGALIHYFKLQPFIVTLAGMFLARGLCYLISINSITIDDPLFVAMSQTQLGFLGGFVSPGVVIAVLTLLLAIWLAHATPFGRAVYAIGGNEQSALMMGLPVGRTKVLIYAFSGFCASLGGVLFSFYMLSGYGLHAQGTELDAIAAVVIGGTLLSGGYGYVAGALSGVLVLGTIQTLIAFDGTLSSWWTKIVIGGLLFVFCVVQRLMALGQNIPTGVNFDVEAE